MFCNNCGEAVSTTEKEGTIHDNGKYACHPNVKPNDPRWSLMATAGQTVEYSEDDHSTHEHAEFIFGTVCLI